MRMCSMTRNPSGLYLDGVRADVVGFYERPNRRESRNIDPKLYIKSLKEKKYNSVM